MINSANIDRNLNPCIGMQFQKAQQWKWVVSIGIRSIPMFRSFHFMYPFLGESLPTILEKGLVIHKEARVSLSCSQNEERLVGNRRLGWSDQERHGSGELGSSEVKTGYLERFLTAHFSISGCMLE